MVPPKKKNVKTEENKDISTSKSTDIVKYYKRTDTTGDKEQTYKTIRKSHPEMAKSKFFQYRMFIDKLQRPPVKEPFLVSSPHWISAGHTQKWPWKSQLNCNLHLQCRSKNVDKRCNHTACWKNMTVKGN